MEVFRRVGTFVDLVWKLANSPTAREQLKYILSRQPLAVAESASDSDAIDVKTMLATLSIDELNRTSDDYFRYQDVASHLGRPFTNAEETAELLIAFSYVIEGLNPPYGADILDFGAGTCWSTRFLTQMSYAVTAMDVAGSALDIGRELFRRVPVMGHHVPPKFVVYDGRRFGLAGESFDRIVCLNAFHHVPNPAEVLNEMARVLRPGGVAGFSEPGAGHSRSSQAQYEMRHFQVLENDIVIEDVERWALEAGFDRLELAVVDPKSYRVSWREYTDIIAGGMAAARYADSARHAAFSRRVFFLYKPGAPPADSRQRRGLLGVLRVCLDEVSVASGARFHGEATVRNTGTNSWLPSDAAFGPVRVGIHLFRRDSHLINHDFGRLPLPRMLRPGESATFRFDFEAPPPGEYRLGFDLLSEHVCWFAENGATSVDIDVTVT